MWSDFFPQTFITEIRFKSYFKASLNCIHGMLILITRILINFNATKRSARKKLKNAHSNFISIQLNKHFNYLHSFKYIFQTFTKLFGKQFTYLVKQEENVLLYDDNRCVSNHVSRNKRIFRIFLNLITYTPSTFCIYKQKLDGILTLRQLTTWIFLL